jgi:hypothetical protein
VDCLKIQRGLAGDRHVRVAAVNRVEHAAEDADSA